MIKKLLRNTLLGLLAVYLLGFFVIYHVECWQQRNRVYTGTVVGINNSMGRYSSTCLMNVNWDGIGEQVINGGDMGCIDYTVGSRISVNRGWNPITGKDGTAYIPEDPKLFSDYFIIELSVMVTECIIVVSAIIGIGMLF